MRKTAYKTQADMELRRPGLRRATATLRHIILRTTVRGVTANRAAKWGALLCTFVC